MIRLEAEMLRWLHLLRRNALAGLAGVLLLVMVFLGGALYRGLIGESRARAREICDTMESTLKGLMLARNPTLIQCTFEGVTKHGELLDRAFLINDKGDVAYSSDRADLGRSFDVHSEPSCVVCHSDPSQSPLNHTFITRYNGHPVLRNVDPIPNEKTCQECHDENQATLGVLIIDRDITPTYAFIAKIELLVGLAGLVAIGLSMWLWTRSANRYASEIVLREQELASLYSIVDRLSKSIAMEDVESIVAEVLHDSLDAEVVDIILPRDPGQFRCTSWSANDSRGVRKKIEADDPLHQAILHWLQLRSGVEVSANSAEIHLPIVSDGVPLVYVIVRRRPSALGSVGNRLVSILEKHIAVTFRNARLYTMAITDGLTGLYTRRHFDHSLPAKFSQAIQNGEDLGLLMIDVDNFKAVNDCQGHAAGDRALCGIATAILSAIRSTDLAFRYGGDEIALILPATSLEESVLLAERLRLQVAETDFGVPGRTVSLSVGVAAAPLVAKNVHDLLSAADTAMYRAKNMGKNRVAVSAGNIEPVEDGVSTSAAPVGPI